MRLSQDETRALAFVAALLGLSAVARAVHRPPAFAPDEPALDLAALEQASDSARETAERRSRPLEPGERIDPNTATADELQRLPRVGPALAARIVAERERAPFRSAADLGRVSGIGPRMAEALAPLVSLPAASPAAAADPAVRVLGAGGAGRTEPARIDVNRATAAELERLPGIGPALAQRIVAYRDSAGPFRELEELRRVPGIGPATVARLDPHLKPLY